LGFCRFGIDPDVLNKVYADRPNWSLQAHGQMAAFSNPRVWEFMSRVLKCAAIKP